MSLADKRHRHTALRVILVAMLAMIAAACTDERIPAGEDSGEAGLPSVVTLALDIDGAAEAVSRSDMSEGLDRQVTSLWIAVYNATTGARTGVVELSDIDEKLNHDFRKVTVNTLSGPSYIVGVANFINRYAITDASGRIGRMADALASADTWEKYCAISVAFDSKGGAPMEAPLNALLMSGHYTDEPHADGSLPPLMAVAIAPGNTTPAGAVHLRRLISHINFNVRYNTDNIDDFEIVSWQVENLPATCWLSERRDGDADINAPDVRTAAGNDFVTTADMTDVVKEGNTVAFDWWQLENRRTGRVPEGIADSGAYYWRQKEHKADDGSNTGLYCALVDADAGDLRNNSATRVRLRVSMRMKVDENGRPLDATGTQVRLVEATYTIHLGYCEGDTPLSRATDFRCRRNTRYTYNATINNVSDIIVEATATDATGERNPAVEGIVSDISGEFFEVDAHYAAMNIYLSRSDIDEFQYYIAAYDLQGDEIIINSMRPATVPAAGDDRYRYLSWVELRATTGESVLAAYRPASDAGTYLLPEIRGNNAMRAGWYTLFINEYVYEDNADERNSMNWHGYVNRPDRRVWLNVAGHISPDGASIWYDSKYAVSQKSIQTYYNGLSDSALGVEHVNETYGLNLRNAFNPRRNTSGTNLNLTTTAGRNDHSGRFNVAQYLTGAKNTSLSWTDDRYSWSDFVDQTAMQSVNAINNQNISRPAATWPLPAVKTRNNGNEYQISGVTRYDADRTANPKYVEAIATCLGRNRDLDGDGRISADEIRWFVPVAAQIVRVVLGRRALEHPLFDPVGIERLPNGTSLSNGENSSLLMYASDGKVVWLMEGLSQSSWRQNVAHGTPWEVRCVRNLGGNLTVINRDNVTTPAYSLRPGTNIVDLHYYDPLAVRSEPYLDSRYPMPVHHINDQRYNRCYSSFEFADSILCLNDPRLGLNGKTIRWAEYLAETNPCRVLDRGNKTGWRVPNQKELTIIGVLGKYNLNAPGGNAYQISCSYSYFDTDGYAPGYNPDNTTGNLLTRRRVPMKIRTSDGGGTQADNMDEPAIRISNNYYGVRCVRDVE